MRVLLLIVILIWTVALVAQAPPPALTLKDAQAAALKNHPNIVAAQNEVAAMEQLVIAARAPYYPMVSADATGSQGNHNARIGANSLSASRLFDRFGQGITVSQLITDSGRTNNLVANSRLQAQASSQLQTATRYDVLLAVTRAYYDVLRAQATVKLAEKTVETRKVLFDQVNTLFQNNLKSQLDVSFTDVNLSDAQLLLIRAQESVQQGYAELAHALGTEQIVQYQLTEDAMPPAPPTNADDLVAQAFNNRPELASLRSSRDAAYKFVEAEKDLSRPTVSFVGVAGALPLLAPNPGPNPVPVPYEGAAVNIDIPIFNGHLFGARREAAYQRALESDQRLRAARDRIARDVRIVLAGASTAYQRLTVTASFVRQANLALEYAQERYKLGLSSIVELTQAQLNLTRAQIEDLSSHYDYQSEYASLQYAMGLLR